MDALAVGRLLALSRLRQGLRQVDVATRARLSVVAISRQERGMFTTIRRLTRHANALGLRLDFRVVGRGGELDRLADDEHAAIVEAVAATFRAVRHETELELSFSEWGERGRIDVLTFERSAGLLTVVEVKGEVTNIQELLGSLDTKRRIAPVVARRLGWRAQRTTTVLVVAATGANRRLVGTHRVTFAAFEQSPFSRRSVGQRSGKDKVLLWITPARVGRKRWIAGRRRVRAGKAATAVPAGPLENSHRP